MPLSSASARYPGGTGAAIAAPGSYAGTFIPEIWSRKLLAKFYAATVLSGITNTEYEGEIRDRGDRVKIRQRPNITIRPYQPDQVLVFERPNAPTVEFSIDYASYFNVIVDDVWRVQSDMDLLDMWAQDAIESFKVQIDRDMLRNVFLGGAAATNRGATAGAISANVNLGITTAPVTIVPRNPTGTQREIMDLIVDLGQVLDEANVPSEGRWVVLPSYAVAMLKKSELRDASVMGDSQSVFRNGRVGTLDRFEVYQSNLLPHGTAGGLAAGETAVFAGHSMAVTFASQINKVERREPSETFGTAVRGLFVWGCDVLHPNLLTQAIIRRP